jgi:hypothetical protein
MGSETSLNETKTAGGCYLAKTCEVSVGLKNTSGEKYFNI